MEIGLKEYRKLQKQADERKVSEFGSIFDENPIYIPTENAKEAERILKEAQLVLTLEERNELIEISKRKEADKLGNIFYDDDKTRMVETPEAKEAKKLLDKSDIIITIDQRRQLLEQSMEKEINQLSLLSDDKYVETEKARDAKDILEKAKVIISLEQRKELLEKAQEKETDKTLASLGIEERTYTKDAEDAQNILRMSKLVITQEERISLEEASKEQEVNKAAEIFDIYETVDTERAKESKELLAKASVSITLDELNTQLYQSEYNDGNFFMCEEFTDKKMKKELTPNDIESSLEEDVRFSDVEKFNRELISNLKKIDVNTREADGGQRSE